MEEGEIKKIRYSKKFLKHLAKLPQSIIDRAQARERIFRATPFHPLLKTHKLSGRDKECWAFWVTYSIRIKFIFLRNKKVLFLDIGPHPKIYD